MVASPRTDLKVANVEIKVAGQLLATRYMDQLVDLRVEQDLNLPSRVELRFNDDDFAILASGPFVVGTALEVSVTDIFGQQGRLISAEITALAVDQGPTGVEELTVEGLDKGHRLSRSIVPTTFLNQTETQIIQQIASRNGLRASIGSGVIASKTPYLLHLGNDYELVDRLVRQLGSEWWIEEATLYVQALSAGGGDVKLTWGDNMTRFRVRQTAADNVNKVEFRSWNHDTQRPIVSAEVIKNDGLSTTASVGSDLRDRRARSIAEGNRLVTNLPVADQGTGSKLAKSLGERASVGQVVARGEALGMAVLKPGTKVNIAGLPASLAGSYLLTRVEHIYGQEQGYMSRFVSGSVEPSSIVDLLGQRAPDRTLPWGQAGVVVGVVTNNNDRDGLGRVKVKFPTLSDQVESNWCVASVGAGPTGGLSDLPEVNDEVIVVFEHGDVQRPIVLGAVWSAKNKPPPGILKNGKVNKRTWKTRKGHHIEFIDDVGKNAMVTVALGDGSTSVVLKQDGADIVSKGKITLEGDQGVIIKSKAKVEITGNTGASMKTPSGTAEIEGTTTTVKGKTQVTVEGGASAKLSSKGSTSVESTGATQVKGSILKLN